jgi:hypothetical protein
MEKNRIPAREMWWDVYLCVIHNYENNKLEEVTKKVCIKFYKMIPQILEILAEMMIQYWQFNSEKRPNFQSISTKMDSLYKKMTKN